MTAHNAYPSPHLSRVRAAAAEPGVRYHCDACGADITLTVRVRCAGGCEDFDLCGSCFCAGTEVGRHKAWHEYRVVVSHASQTMSRCTEDRPTLDAQAKPLPRGCHDILTVSSLFRPSPATQEQHSYPIFCADWGADEELLLIDGCQIYGLGNWADIADHIGNRTKEEVEQHYVQVYVEGRDGTPAGDARARAADEAAAREGKRPPVVGPNEGFEPDVDLEEFQRRKRRRIEDLRDMQAAYHPPKATKPLVSAPTNHSELAGFMPGRLEFEHEYEQEAEHLTKDMEFGRVYRFGGAEMPAEHEALGAVLPVQGAPRMEASRRGAPTNAPAAAAATKKTAGTGEADEGAGDETGTSDRPQADASNARSGSPPTPENDSQAAAAAPAAASAGDAEDRAPDWDEDEADLELKLAVLEMYNERLDRRARRKQFVFERNLVDLKRVSLRIAVCACRTGSRSC